MSKPKFKIGVSGSMLGENPQLLKKAYDVGAEIASQNCILMYGACNGYPREAVRGSLDKGGVVVGISPSANITEHEKTFGFTPFPEEIIIYSGLGKHARDVLFVRGTDAMLFISGAEGTLLEFCAAYGSNKIIAILDGSGGISDHLEEIKSWFYKKPGVSPVIVKSDDPKELLQKVLDALSSF